MDWTTEDLRGMLELVGHDYCQQVGAVGEGIIADILTRAGIRFIHTSDEGVHHPMDFILTDLDVALEVKTMLWTKGNYPRDVPIAKPHRKQKEDWCRMQGMKGYVVVLYCTGWAPEGSSPYQAEYHTMKLLVKPGFKRYPVDRMDDFSGQLWAWMSQLGLVTDRKV